MSNLDTNAIASIVAAILAQQTPTPAPAPAPAPAKRGRKPKETAPAPAPAKPLGVLRFEAISAESDALRGMAKSTLCLDLYCASLVAMVNAAPVNTNAFGDNASDEQKKALAKERKTAGETFKSQTGLPLESDPWKNWKRRVTLTCTEIASGKRFSVHEEAAAKAAGRNPGALKPENDKRTKAGSQAGRIAKPFADKAKELLENIYAASVRQTGALSKVDGDVLHLIEKALTLYKIDPRRIVTRVEAHTAKFTKKA